MTDPMAAALAALRQEYIDELPGKFAELRGALAGFAEGSADAQALLKQRFHRLAGSAGSYGFSGASTVARETEHALVGGTATAESLAQAIDRLEAEFRGGI